MAESEKAFRRCQAATLKKTLREVFLHKQSQFDKLLRKTERNYNRQLADEIESLNTDNPREFWQHIKQLGPQKKKPIPLKVEDASNNIVEDLEIVLERWKQDYENLYNKPDLPNSEFDEEFYSDILTQKENFESNGDHYQDAVFNRAFCLQEIYKVQRKIKSGKSTGIDMIPNEVLKHTAVAEALVTLFNKCFLYGIIPSVWNKAIISPIPKGSNKNPYVPLNYRGISLISCVYKFYSSLLNIRITENNETNQLYVDEQNGFRKDRSCLDHIHTATTVISNRMANKQSTFAAFVDMKKAFDWVDRDLLFFKMYTQFNLGGKVYNAVKSLYSGPLSCVKINNYNTDWFSISSGVKQGDSLSPTLFAMYLNDLAVEIKDLNCGINIDGFNLSILMYADDIILLASDENSLQTQLDTLHSWCRRWRMVVNEEKTQVCHFRPKRKACTSHDFKYGASSLQIVSSYKYLGVFLDEHLSYVHHVDSLAKAASRSLGFLRHKLSFLKECRSDTFTKLYSSYVCPVMDYCSAVWGSKMFPKLEQVQYRALRYLLGVHRFAPIDVLLGDSGWTSCYSRHKLSTIRLWNRLCLMPSDRLTSRVFLWDMSQYNVSGTWSHNIFKIFEELQKTRHFHEIIPFDLKAAYNCILENESYQWNEHRYNKPKLRLYNLYKASYEQEEYISFNASRYKKSLLAQLRAGILPLQVEVGRYRNVPLSSRVCELCDSNEVEDEIHFLLVCRRFETQRHILYEKAKSVFPTFDQEDAISKFVLLMNNLQKEVMDFTYNSVMLRRNIVYKENR